MRKIIFALAFGALLLPDYGFTLGLGEIEVTTALNQELNAEIKLLSAAPEDVETLIVKLASREEFARAGIDRPYMLNSLKFATETRGGVPYIRVTSDKPVREPFLSFLVEVDWPKGHMMREYTILLDPPVFMGQQAPVQQEQMRPAAMEALPPVSTGRPEPQSSSGSRPAAFAVPAATTSSTTVPVAETGMQTPQAQAPYQAAPAYTQTHYQSPGGYRIKQGDTLWSLADSMRPDRSVTIEQMMLAMLRSNPEAFINQNVNGLKRGYILRIPDRDDIITLNQAEAVAIVREQNALWREYYQSVAGGEPASALDTEAHDGVSAGLDESGDSRLEIVAAGSGTEASGTKDATQMSTSELRAELALAREALETERVEKEELEQRLVSLEGQVERMKSLLTLQDSDMAELQQAATPAEAGPMPEVGATEEAMLDELADAVIDETVTEDGTAVEEIEGTEEMAIEETADDGIAEQEVFIDEEPVAMVEEVVEQPVPSTEVFSVAPNTEPAFMQQKDKGPISALLNNPLLLAAAGGGLLILLLLIALISKRRKSGEDETLVAGNLDDIAGQIDAHDDITATEVGQVVQKVAPAETEAAAVAETEELEPLAEQSSAEDALASSSETGAEDEDQPRDDIIAEADVYLAYGIYQQAEELLQNAIKNNPDNDSYRVKLAETYSASKNTDAFIDLATEMYQRRGGEDSTDWQKIAAIGSELVPDHALFTGAPIDDLSMDDLASHSPESADIDLASAEEQEALAPDLDLAFDESEAGIVEPVAEESLESEDSVEFDLSETGAEAAADVSAETVDGVEFGLDETQAFEAEHTTQEFSLDIEASELGIEEDEDAPADEYDLDLSTEAQTELAADDDTEDSGFSLDDVDAASLDLDAGDGGAGDAVSAEQLSDEEETQDESAAILEFKETAREESGVEAAAGPGMVEPEIEFASYADTLDDDLDLSALDDIDEVSTKLDLAKAYLDMGDADGTRSILDEVMSEGNDDQKKEADDLLRQLG